jgi:hypothetical protein
MGDSLNKLLSMLGQPKAIIKFQYEDEGYFTDALEYQYDITDLIRFSFLTNDQTYKNRLFSITLMEPRECINIKGDSYCIGDSINTNCNNKYLRSFPNSFKKSVTGKNAYVFTVNLKNGKIMSNIYACAISFYIKNYIVYCIEIRPCW